MSHLIDRLDAQIAQAEGVVERELLKSRRAAVLARYGHMQEARFALAGMRTQSQRLRNPVLAGWVAFVDGLIDHCEALSAGARDKFRRAHELASGAGDALLQAESAGWLAMTELNANDVDSAARHVAEALDVVPADAHAAHARAAMVAGNAWYCAGEESFALPWYKRARQHATEEGDVSLVSMLLYDMAVFRAHAISLEAAFGRPDVTEAQRSLLEAESTGNYDANIGNAQLAAQVPLLRAQLLVVIGRHEEAVAVIDATLASVRDDSLARREAWFHADAAFAEVQLGRLDEAAKRLRLLAAALPRTSDDDDLAAAHARAACVMRALGRQGQAEAHAREAEVALARFRAEQQRWAHALRAANLDR